MKRIVICCDGTWQRPLQNWKGVASPTNVVRLAARVAKRDGSTVQVLYYDEGVGTGNLFDRVAGGLFGAGLDRNIFEAYRFLIANFEPGDELYLFGFSRGAYTVRSLAGMIRKCGIVRRDKVVNESSAIGLYRSAERPDDPGPLAFRSENAMGGARPVPIKLIGVWDTVGSLGIPLRTSKRYAFHDTDLSSTVEHAYHALAIDERRKTFAPTIWTAVDKRQKVEQRWFSGTHSDVGGGIGSHGLPDITLGWMCDRARAAGLALDPAVLAAYPLRSDLRAPFNKVERSMVWRLLGGRASRKVGVNQRGEVDRSQVVDDSAWKRRSLLSAYRPQNLDDYFALTKDPRGASPRDPAAALLAQK